MDHLSADLLRENLPGVRGKDTRLTTTETQKNKIQQSVSLAEGMSPNDP